MSQGMAQKKMLTGIAKLLPIMVTVTNSWILLVVCRCTSEVNSLIRQRTGKCNQLSIHAPLSLESICQEKKESPSISEMSKPK